jgi:hypothetical protein
MFITQFYGEIVPEHPLLSAHTGADGASAGSPTGRAASRAASWGDDGGVMSVNTAAAGGCRGVHIAPAEP